MSKLRLVKLPDYPSTEDLEYWRLRFEKNEPTQEELDRKGIVVEDVETEAQSNTMTLIKIGGDDYKPTLTELEEWRKIFEDAVGDRDFKVFTHEAVEVLPIKYEDLGVTIITGNAVVIRK